MNELLVAVLPGLTDYLAAFDLQKRLVALQQQGEIQDILLLLEHPSIITLGKNADNTHVLCSEEFLKSRGIKIYKSDRGGNVTYHGPGQIIGYPILNIRKRNLGIKKYIWLLEQIFIDLLSEEYLVNAYREPSYRGVWVNNKKITAIGCAVKYGITMHGFAFNVNTNLNHFNYINPCGLSEKGVTSLEEILGYPVELQIIHELLVKYFSNCFNTHHQIITTSQLQKLVGVESIV